MTEQAGVISTNDPFFSAKLKVQWANHHINQLQAFLNRLTASDMYRIVIEDDTEKLTYKLKVLGMEVIPAEIPLFIGDVIHNLRSALDHVNTVILGVDKDNVYFPFHQDRKQFISCANKRAINQACPGLGDYIVDSLEPFEGGRKWLWSLTKLDARDKHKLIVTTMYATNVFFDRVVDKQSGFIAEDVTVSVRNGSFFIRYAIPNRPEFEGDIKVSLDVFFGVGTFLDGKPVIPTLANLSQAVSEAISAIAQFIADARCIVGRNEGHRAAS